MSQAKVDRYKEEKKNRKKIQKKQKSKTGSGDFSMCRYFRCSGRFPSGQTCISEKL